MIRKRYAVVLLNSLLIAGVSAAEAGNGGSPRSSHFSHNGGFAHQGSQAYRQHPRTYHAHKGSQTYRKIARPGKLRGDPKGKAIDALTEVEPIPARDADIVNGIILNKLEIGLSGTATVGQVNAALDRLNARIGSMRPGDATLTVVFPRAADLAALRQKQRSLDGAPGIRFVDLATTAAPEILPPAPADFAIRVGHLFPSRFPAAWNASHRALKNCETRKVPLRIFDHFGLPPVHSAEELPGLTFANSFGFPFGSHGYIVAGAAAAAFDSGLTTGANPFWQCLDLQGIHAANLSAAESRRVLAAHLPAGKFILNRSLAVGQPTCTSAPPSGCVPSDFAGQEDWFGRTVRGAIAWRKEFAPRDGDMLLVTTAGNEADKQGLVYGLFYQSAISDDVRVAASPLLFGGTSLQVLQDHALLDARAGFNNFPSFALSDAQVQSIGAYLRDALGPSPTPAPNILTVGSVNRPATGEVQESAYSDRNPHLHAVGEDVWGVDDMLSSGTSVAAPQVAGLASYLWLLSDELRSQPVSATRHAILDNTRLVGNNVHLLDAYAAILSLDEPGPATPASAPIRLALLDLDDDDQFDEVDLEAFAAAILDSSGVGSPKWDRFDLNGDGFTGGVAAGRFDLDKVGSTRCGTSVYSMVSQVIEGSPVSFDESAVSDKDVLCYYAYSALYTGDETKRHDRLAAACASPPASTDTVRSIVVTVASGSKIFALEGANQGETNHLWAGFYDTVERKWSQAVPIAPEGEMIGNATATLVAAPNGDMLAGWIIFDRSIRDGSIRIARYNHNTATWAPPVTAGTAGVNDTFGSADFALGLNARGDAVAAWTAPGGTTELPDLWVGVAPRETGVWSSPVHLAENQIMGRPSIAVDSLGTFYVAWGGRESTQVARYDGQWRAPETIPQTGNRGSNGPRLAADRLGNVYATWRKNPSIGNGDTNLYASIRDAASGTWSTSVLDNCPSVYCMQQQIVVNGAGDAEVVWSRAADGFSPHSVKASCYRRVAQLWIEAVTLSAPGADFAVVAIDSAGTGRVVWTQSMGPRIAHVVSRRYQIPGGWGPIELLEDKPGGGVPTNLMSTDSGTMLLIWWNTPPMHWKQFVLVLEPQ
jgi:hypothetical protein